ncbi:MAG: hypothetical protein AAFO72_03850 [Pseudomonadota bacterium]
MSAVVQAQITMPFLSMADPSRLMATLAHHFTPHAAQPSGPFAPRYNE